jgi:hypothetical protein
MALLLLYSIVIQYPGDTGIPISHRQHRKAAIFPRLKAPILLLLIYFLAPSGP